MSAKLVISLILAGLAAVLIIQNVAVVDLRILFWTLSMSGALLMCFTLSVGIILGWLLRGSFSRRKSFARNKNTTVVNDLTQ